MFKSNYMFRRGAVLFLLTLLGVLGEGNAQQVHLNIKKDHALFMEGSDSVLVYQIKPKSVNGQYERADYIHPLFSLDGVPITEDFPDDHLHHRGIFWAWHQLYLKEKRIGDGWEIKDFEWEVVNNSKVGRGHKRTTLKSAVIWKSPLVRDTNGKMEPLVKETNWITVYPKTSNYRVIDIKIQLRGLFEDMGIGGSEDEKGYGGFSARVQLSDDILFKDSGHIITPENTPVTGKDWINIISRTKKDNSKYGLAIIPSKDNPDYPNPWILRTKASMQNAVYPFPGAVPVILSNKTQLVLKYRLVVHDGSIDHSILSSLQQHYSRLKD